MYQQFYEIDNINNILSKSEWVKGFESEEMRIYFRQEKGMPNLSFLTDIVIDANLIHLVACFENLHILEEMFQDFHDLQWVHKRGNANGLLYA